MSTLDELLRERLEAVGSWQPTALRLAAVLCPIAGEPGDESLVFAVRPADLRQHAGQIGFPGGMRTGDEDPVACALRECEEEIGVPPAAVHVLGGLPPRESSSRILVHCLVGRLDDVPFTPDPREVVRVLTIPLRELRDDARWHERTPPQSATGYQPRTSPHFESGEDLLWGLTARFVRDFVTRLA
jgi:8-oxo-dGTP pyrophosphatase MutT (NUDIX family)